MPEHLTDLLERASALEPGALGLLFQTVIAISWFVILCYIGVALMVFVGGFCAEFGSMAILGISRRLRYGRKVPYAFASRRALNVASFTAHAIERGYRAFARLLVTISRLHTVWPYIAGLLIVLTYNDPGSLSRAISSDNRNDLASLADGALRWSPLVGVVGTIIPLVVLIVVLSSRRGQRAVLRKNTTLVEETIRELARFASALIVFLDEAHSNREQLIRSRKARMLAVVSETPNLTWYDGTVPRIRTSKAYSNWASVYRSPLEVAVREGGEEQASLEAATSQIVALSRSLSSNGLDVIADRLCRPVHSILARHRIDFRPSPRPRTRPLFVLVEARSDITQSLEDFGRSIGDCVPGHLDDGDGNDLSVTRLRKHSVPPAKESGEGSPRPVTDEGAPDEFEIMSAEQEILNRLRLCGRHIDNVILRHWRAERELQDVLHFVRGQVGGRRFDSAVAKWAG